ncbi:MAG: hypothetical protein NTV52_29660, partial [Acidobacteria bacterium]|nr:hypothetical protein [Acidobacteriota bacterium]
MSNVLTEEKKQQVLTLGRLGWSLRRLEKQTGIRRETAATYLSSVRGPLMNALSARSSSIQPRHVRGNAALVQKHKPLRVDAGCLGPPLLSPPNSFRAILLAGV